MNRNSDPRQEVESLAAGLQQLAENRGTPAYRLFVESVAGELANAANTDESLESARQTIESYQQATELQAGPAKQERSPPGHRPGRGWNQADADADPVRFRSRP